MATSGNVDSGGYQGRYIHFEWSTQSISAENNTRTIKYSFTAQGGSSSSYYHHNNVFQLNGETVYSGGQSDYIKTGTVLAEGTYTINQNNTTKLRVDMDGGIYSYGNNINTAGEWDLDTIPRYANLTSLTIKSRTVNSITFSFTADKTCRIYAKIVSPITTDWLNNGNPFKDNVTSGEFTINYKDRANSTRLDPNTKYKFTILCRNTVSQLDTSKDIEATTFDIAKLVNVPNVNIGNKQTITWTNPSGAVTTLKLCKTDNSQIANIGTVTGTSKDYTATASTIYALTPNSNTYKARYILTTTQNSQSYTNSKDFNFIVTNSNPTFSNFTYKDTNSKTTALTGNNQKMVNGYSNIQATVSTSNKAVAKNSATMKSYILAIGSKTSNSVAYSSTTDVNLSINAINSSTLKLSATDSRGNSTTVTKTIATSNYLQYSKPVVKSVVAERGTGGIGTEVTLTYSGTFWNSSFGSVTNALASVKYYYRVAGSGATWTTGTTTLSPTISGNNFSQTIIIQGDLAGSGFDRDKNFEIKVIVTDKLDSGENTYIFSSGTPLMARHKNGIAIKQKYNTSTGGALQTNGSIVAKSGSSNVILNAGGGIELSHATTPYIDFHYGNSTKDFTSRLYESSSGTLSITNNLTIGGNTTTHNIFANGYIGQLAGTINSSTSTNFNNAYREGEFSVGSGSSITGAPHTGAIYGKLIIKVNDGSTHNNSNNWIWQTFLETNGKIWKRNKTNGGGWSNWDEIRQGVITGYKTLYGNTSGTTGNITLSESAANFNWLEIVYDSGGYMTKRVYAPNGRMITIPLHYYVNNLAQVQFVYLTISGTTITRGKSYYFNYANQGESNDIKVFYVLGYR